MNNKRRDFLKKAGTYISASAVTSLIRIPYVSANNRITKIGSGQDLEKIKALLERKKPNIWLFTGDSITHGAKHTQGYRSCARWHAPNLQRRSVWIS